MRNFFLESNEMRFLKKKNDQSNLPVRIFSTAGRFSLPSSKSVNLVNEKNGSNDFFENSYIDLFFDDLESDDVTDPEILLGDVIIGGQSGSRKMF